MPARPLPTATRHAKASAAATAAAATAVSPAARNTAAVAAHPDGVDRATAASVLKIAPPMPNKPDEETGWGPVENLTVAALDFARNNPAVPKETESFVALARWLANASQPAGGAAPAAEDGEPSALSEDDLKRFQAVARQLLGLNKNALMALIPEGAAAGGDSAGHSARQLWRSIPQPANMPAVRAWHPTPAMVAPCCPRPCSAEVIADAQACMHAVPSDLIAVAVDRCTACPEPHASSCDVPADARRADHAGRVSDAKHGRVMSAAYEHFHSPQREHGHVCRAAWRRSC